MRTTLTLDPDVSALLKKTVARDQVSFKQAVNEALRRGLSDVVVAQPKKRFVQRLMPSGEFLIDVSNNGAIWEMWDREDYPDLHRRESPAPSDGSKGD